MVLTDYTSGGKMIDVTYIDHMGDDLAVVNAARVSFAKESFYDVATYNSWQGDDTETLTLKDQDKKLINYLAAHKHKSPFNHCFAKFRVKAPIFVARQLQKHEYMVWNEVSRRYVDDAPEFYMPDGWRRKADNVKQGSSNELVTELAHGEDEMDLWGDIDNKFHPDMHIELHYFYCLDTYKRLLASGVAPEQARMVLPQSMMTEWIWSGSLYAFAKMCALRLDSHAQHETRIVAEKIDGKMWDLFPVSWTALQGNIL